MKSTERDSDSDCQPEKTTEFHWMADRASERLASGVGDNERRLPGFAHQLQWPQRPLTIEVVPEFVFVREAIDTLERSVRGSADDGYERVPMAPEIVPG
jgi:hypothetical protein